MLTGFSIDNADSQNIAALPKESAAEKKKETRENEDVKDSVVPPNNEYKQELQEIRNAIASTDGFTTIKEMPRKGNTLNTLKIGEGENQITLIETIDTNVFVAQKGDKTFVFNKNNPDLDIMATKTGLPAAEQSLPSEKRKEFKHGLETAMESLKNYNIDQDRGTLLKSELAIMEAARQTGVMEEANYAENIALLGSRYVQDMNDFGSGRFLQEKGLKILEREKGKSDPKTMEIRDDMMDTYLRMNNLSGARNLMNKQIEALSTADSRNALDLDVVFLRRSLIKKLSQFGEEDKIAKVLDSANQLVQIQN